MVQWLGRLTFPAKGPGSIPGWGTKIQQTRCPKKKRHWAQVPWAPETCTQTQSLYASQPSDRDSIAGPLPGSLDSKTKFV